MITRPLDLGSKLRPPPRSFDTLFWVNGGLIVLFFGLFGSRFVLSPGLPLENENFALPSAVTSVETAAVTSVVISLPRPGMALTDNGLYSYAGLKTWMAARVADQKGPLRLLVQADATVPMKDLVELHDMARLAGFQSVQVAAQSQRAASPFQ